MTKAPSAKLATRRNLTRDDFLTTFATAGMTEGQKRLWRFADAMRRGTTPAPDDMREIASAFRAILDGADPKKALGIGGKQHQGRRKLTVADVDRNLHLSMAVEELRASMTKDEAIKKVADDARMNVPQVETLYRRDRLAARFVLQQERALKVAAAVRQQEDSLREAIAMLRQQEGSLKEAVAFARRLERAKK